MKATSVEAMEALLDRFQKKSPKIAVRFMNLFMPQLIPFNRPLKFRITKLDETGVQLDLPCRRSTKNHLGGLHACAMATAGEYAAGLLLLTRIKFSKTRLVLKTLQVEYFKQGRATAQSTARWPDQMPNLDNISDPIDIEMTSLITAPDGAELAVVRTVWQLKSWDKVKSKKKL